MKIELNYKQVVLDRDKYCARIYVQKSMLNTTTTTESLLIEEVSIEIEHGIMCLKGYLVEQQYATGICGANWDFRCPIEDIPADYIYDKDSIFTEKEWCWKSFSYVERKYISSWEKVRTGRREISFIIKSWELVR